MFPLRALVIEDHPDVSAPPARHLRELGCPVAVACPREGRLGLAFVRGLREDERTKGCHPAASSVLDPQDRVGLRDETAANPFRQSAVVRLPGAYRSSVAQEPQGEQWLMS